MYNIKFGKYYNTYSDLHNMDSFYKILCLFIFAITLFLIQNFLIILLIYLFVFSLIVISNIEINVYLKNLKTILVLSIFIIIINIIFNSDIIDTIIQISKLILIVTYSAIIMHTTTNDELTIGIEKFLSPLNKIKVNVKSISLIISLTIRFIPIILNQTTKVLKSQSSRGLDLRTEQNIINKIKSINSIILPIFILSFKRADEIADYMELRLYDSNHEIEKPKVSKNSFDNLLLLSHVFLLIIYIFMR